MFMVPERSGSGLADVWQGGELCQRQGGSGRGHLGLSGQNLPRKCYFEIEIQPLGQECLIHQAWHPVLPLGANGAINEMLAKGGVVLRESDTLA
jgi:hypothetical protein